LTKRSSPAVFYLNAHDLKRTRNIQGTLKESGDVILSRAKIYAELGRSAGSQSSTARKRNADLQVVSMAVEDIAAAALVYRASRSASKL